MDEILGNPALVGLFGILSTFLISFLKNCAWPEWAKQLLALGVSCVMGVAVVWVREEAGETDWTPEVVIAHIATVLTVAQFVYQFLIKGSTTGLGAINQKLEAIGSSEPEPVEIIGGPVVATPDEVEAILRDRREREEFEAWRRARDLHRPGG